MQHPDEGTIHAWLDGALSPDEAREMELHVASCEPCRALVAEARGLIAASSRILSALDDVPGGVIPGRADAEMPAAMRIAAAAAAAAPSTQRSRRIWGMSPNVLRAAAALLIAAVGVIALARSPSRKESATLAEMKAVPESSTSLDEVAKPTVSPPAANQVATSSQASAGAPALSPPTVHNALPPRSPAAAQGNERRDAQPTDAMGRMSAPEPRSVAGAAGTAGSGATLNDVGSAPVNAPARTERAMAAAAQPSTMQKSAEAAKTVAPSAMAPNATSPNAAAGCWELTVGQWSTNGPNDDAGDMVTLPREIMLDTVAATAPFSSGGYTVRGLTPTAYRWASWRPVAADSVKIAWTTDGHTWLTMFLRVGDGSMEGTAQLAGDPSQAVRTSHVIAKKLACTTR